MNFEEFTPEEQAEFRQGMKAGEDDLDELMAIVRKMQHQRLEQLMCDLIALFDDTDRDRLLVISATAINRLLETK